MILALTALLAALGAAETQERSRGRLRQLGNRLGTSVTPISFMRRRLDAILRERPEARPWLEQAYGTGDWLEDLREFDKEDRWQPSDGLVLDWISRVAKYPDLDTQISIEAVSTAGVLEEGWEREMDVGDAMDYLVSLAKEYLQDQDGEDWDIPRATMESIPLVGEDGTITWNLAYSQFMTPGISLAFGLETDNWIVVRLGQAHLRAPGDGTWWTPERWRAMEVQAAENLVEWSPFFAAMARVFPPLTTRQEQNFSTAPTRRPSRQPGGWLLQFDRSLTDRFLKTLKADAHRTAELQVLGPEWAAVFDINPELAEYLEALKALSEADPKWADHLKTFAEEIQEHRALRWRSPEKRLGKLFWLRQEVQDHVRAYGDGILRSTSLDVAADALLAETIRELIAERDKALEALGEGDEVVRVRWPDGGTIVELLTPAALAMEGARMHHCIGREQQGHPAAFRRRETQVFSVRLPNGTPRGTLEVDRDNGTLRDVNGPYNGEISPSLLRDRLAWFFVEGLRKGFPHWFSPPSPSVERYKARILTGRLAGASVEAGGVDAQLVPSEEGR